MILCPYCGVEVDDAAAPCPLCQRPVSQDVSLGPRRAPTNAPAAAAGPLEARRRVRRWLLELFAVLAAVGSTVILVIGLSSGHGLEWARYPLAGIWFLWLLAIAPLYLPSRHGAILAVESAVIAAFLAVLDQFTSGPAWFLPLALPMTALAAIDLYAALVFIRQPGRSPFAAIAASLLAAGVFAFGLEVLLDHFLEGHMHPGWSLVALGSVLPLVLLLLYLRKWYQQRQAELQKLMHL